jgi:heat shock protein HslJ
MPRPASVGWDAVVRFAITLQGNPLVVRIRRPSLEWKEKDSMNLKRLVCWLILPLAVSCADGAPEAGETPEEAEAQVTPAGTASGGGAQAPTEVSPEDQEAILSAGLLGEWRWIDFQGMDGGTLQVDDPARYTLTFRVDGVAVQADCNSGRASFDLDGSGIRFGPVATTMMACPGESLADRYLGYLGNVQGWRVEDEHLFLSLSADAGIMEFEPGGGGA